MRKIEVLLFDLGGVLVDFVGVESLHALTNERYDLEDVRRRWPRTSSLAVFETGDCSAVEFAGNFTSEWDLDMHPKEFFEQFVSWSRMPFQGTHDLLESLKSDYTTACLSNINEAHWRRNRDGMDLGRLFHRHYLSHEIKLRKPDPRIYEYVASDLDCPPQAIAFFDDTPENVDAAKDLGFSAHLVRGLDALKEALVNLGVAPHPLNSTRPGPPGYNPDGV